MNDLRDEMEELSSAEEFLEFFGISYDEAVVRVNRLHILQRFHSYMAREPAGGDERAHMAALLRRAYEDFVRSDARSEKVFKVFRMHEPQVAVVPITSITRRPS